MSQFQVTLPHSKKTISISRDTKFALDLENKMFAEFMNTINEKIYMGEFKETKVALKFQADGRIDTRNSMIELSSQYTDPKIQEAIMEVIIAINNTLFERAEQVSKKLKQNQKAA